ncbi:Chaperone for protein-folding [Metschnikowia aff. pulcherrima]|uniref:Protein ROT1 n=1 Tax=Metschnikowia aff. pulcherrima TaxID=2163413 RepID=A0A4P6XWD1_9ASCO|nr:Chaperone for protein-folding [Metschnikowia aff. pulcherrima]
MHYLSAIFAALFLIQRVLGEPNMEELEGTWLSKLNSVFTGPGFYDPVDELLVEPALPGISYSFTSDGHFEEALYRITSDPSNHSCAIASILYQHGTYEILSNGSVVLTPIAVDGRQLLSDPCGTNAENAQYTRYVQPTWFEKFQVSVSQYYGRYMLQIYQFDGSPMQPLYLAYKPPMMLPTEALNPTDKASETASSLRRKIKRSLENQYRTNAVRDFSSGKVDAIWWGAVAVLGVSSAAYVLKG